ncbi:MFS transporter [Aurantimicrobium minutum]|uniref:MFS transporter n=1 Tax=Aurantimicrobium minutum TaxID=708131 RepID=UPI002475C5FF|nr:MFS transporter [Aurantimicrobium minutum]MDH6239414.1 MFS family permease [Aurantimicrobium minutum]
MNTVVPQVKSLRAQAVILFLYFFVFGVGGASWLVRLPDVRSFIDVSTSILGWVLFAGSVGAMTALIASGRFVARFGARTAVVVGFTTLGFGQVVQALSLIEGSAVGVAVGGLIAGLGYGIGDVGINVEGAELEKLRGKSLLPQLHGAYSLGALAGAGIGTLAIVTNFSLVIQMIVIAVITTAIAWFTYRNLPLSTGRTHVSSSEKQAHREPVVLSKRIVFLGLGIMGLSLAEGGSNDWLALSVVDDYGLDTTTAGITFAIMTLAMVITRFSGGRLVDRFGRVFALRVLGTAGVIGILLVILSPTIYLAWLGAALWGAGVALGFPLFISAAADGENSSQRVATVTAFGYAAFLVGPPLLGFIGQAWGLLNMFYLLALFVACAVFFAGAAKPLVPQKNQ